MWLFLVHIHYNLSGVHFHTITHVYLIFFRVKIKTLKNSVNAVLPDWYPVAPLVRNQDEIFAFTGIFIVRYLLRGNVTLLANQIILPHFETEVFIYLENRL
jgi:hypothetical protein